MWNVINGIVQDDSGTDTARVSRLTFLDIFFRLLAIDVGLEERKPLRQGYSL